MTILEHAKDTHETLLRAETCPACLFWLGIGNLMLEPVRVIECLLEIRSHYPDSYLVIFSQYLPSHDIDLQTHPSH